MLTLSGPEALLPWTIPKQFITGLFYSHYNRTSLLHWNPIISHAAPGMWRAGVCWPTVGCAAHPRGHLWIQRLLAHLHPVHSPSRQRTGLEAWPPPSQHPGYNQPFASHMFLISCIQYPQGSNLIHILFQFSKEGADFVFQTGPTQRTLQM